MKFFTKWILCLPVLFFLTTLTAQSTLEKKISDAKSEIKNLLKNKGKQTAPTDTTNKKNPSNTSGSKPTQQQAQVNKAEYVEIVSPHKNFKSIRMPGHKNKVRLGAGFLEYSKNDLSIQRSQEDYNLLLKMKILDSVFEYLDTKKISPVPTREERRGPDYIRLINANRAQYYLSDLSCQLGTDETYAKYFCKDGIFKAKTYNSCTWGGCNNGVAGCEFEQLDAYRSFINDNNHITLRNWWNKIDREAYLVTQCMLGDYDFDKEGFFLNGQSYHGYQYVRNPKIEGAVDPAKKPNETMNGSVFFKMNMQDAKELKNRKAKEGNIGIVYLVYNIMFYDIPGWRLGPHYANDRLNYYYKTSSVEIFEDWTLTKKLGQITL